MASALIHFNRARDASGMPCRWRDLLTAGRLARRWRLTFCCFLLRLLAGVTLSPLAICRPILGALVTHHPVPLAPAPFETSLALRSARHGSLLPIAPTTNRKGCEFQPIA
jgi:hypothetical protein